MSPVYWKPRYPSRVMRERAWARKSLERERMLKSAGGRPSLIARFVARFRRP